MYLEWLQAQQVRNLNNIYLQPAKQLNVITGKNASGKTAVLESIFLLARAKSFRTPRIQEVIQHKKESLIITAKLQHEKEGEITTGIEKQYGKVTINQNGERIKTVSDQVRKFPIILVTQETQTLITGTPKNRRHWLDWAMFHVEHDYLENWKRYMRALRHRNSLLKRKEKVTHVVTLSINEKKNQFELITFGETCLGYSGDKCYQVMTFGKSKSAN